MTGRLRVRVHPRGRRARVTRGRADGVWGVEVTAAPEGGQADEAVVRLLAEVLSVRRSAVRVVAGSASRTKTIEIEGLRMDEIVARLERAAEAKEPSRGG